MGLGLAAADAPAWVGGDLPAAAGGHEEARRDGPAGADRGPLAPGGPECALGAVLKCVTHLEYEYGRGSEQQAKLQTDF